MQFTKTTLFAVALIALTGVQSAMAANSPAQPNNGQVKPPNTGSDKKVNNNNNYPSNHIFPGSNNYKNNVNNAFSQDAKKRSRYQQCESFLRKHRHSGFNIKSINTPNNNNNNGPIQNNKNGQAPNSNNGNNGFSQDAKTRSRYYQCKRFLSQQRRNGFNYKNNNGQVQNNKNVNAPNNNNNNSNVNIPKVNNINTPKGNSK